MTRTGTRVVERLPIGTPAFRATRRDLLVLPIGLAIFWFIFSGPPVRRIGDFDMKFGLEGPISTDPWKWLGAVLLVALVLLVERRTLASMLLVKPTSKDLEWVLYAFGAVMALSWLAQRISPQEGNSGVETVVALGVPGVIALILTAGITEEIAFRGYLQERFGALLRSRLLGAAVSFGIFLIPHLAFFGPSWLLHQLPGALALVLISLIRRNLVATMVLHLLINAPILIPTVLAQA